MESAVSPDAVLKIRHGGLQLVPELPVDRQVMGPAQVVVVQPGRAGPGVVDAGHRLLGLGHLASGRRLATAGGTNNRALGQPPASARKRGKAASASRASISRPSGPGRRDLPGVPEMRTAAGPQFAGQQRAGPRQRAGRAAVVTGLPPMPRAFAGEHQPGQPERPGASRNARRGASGASRPPRTRPARPGPRRRPACRSYEPRLRTFALHPESPRVFPGGLAKRQAMTSFRR